MNNIDQIAARALEEICRRNKIGWNFEDQAIIKSAIEKAHAAGMKQGWNEGREHERKCNEKATAEKDQLIEQLDKLIELKCEICGISPLVDGTPIYRINRRGRKGIWRCWKHMTEEQKDQHQNESDLIKDITGRI